MGAALVIGVDPDPRRREIAKRMGAAGVLDPREMDIVAEVKRLTGGGVDVAIEALGTQETFEWALRGPPPGRNSVVPWRLLRETSASLRCLRRRHRGPSHCHHALPGGKERMRRLMEMVRQHRVDLTPLLTHRFALGDIEKAYALFGERADGVLKVAIRP